MNTEGLLFDYPIPTPRSQPREVAVGPWGGIWFTEFGGNKIGRLGPDGAITEFPIPSADSEPEGITVGPDRNIWFVENGARVFVTGPPVGSDPQPNSLGRVTPDGVVTEFPIPTAASAPTGITTGPDGALWFTESASNKIGRFVPPPIGARSVEARELSFRVPVPFTNFAGKYRLSEDDSCGKHSEQEIIAFQTGNRLQFLFGVDTGGVVGTIQGALIDFDWREGSLICPNTLLGSGAAVERTIRGIVAGVGRRCSCSSGISGPVTIAFTLTPE